MAIADMTSAPSIPAAQQRRPPHLGWHRVGLWALVLIFLAIIVVPIYYVVLVAFSDGQKVFSTPLQWFPSKISVGHFQDVFASLPVLRYLLNTFVLAISSAIISLVVSIPAAYAIARLRVRGGNLILFALLASSMLPLTSSLIPLFKLFSTLQLTNTVQGLIILYTSALLPLSVWVFVSFLRQMPAELDEAARIDGAGVIRILRSVILPLLWPGMATMFLINFISSWNEFFTPLVFAHSASSKVLGIGLLEASSIGSYSSYTQNWGNISTVAIIATIPMFVVTLAFQRKITEGLTMGAVR